MMKELSESNKLKMLLNIFYHKVVHTGERKFECPFCKTKFSLRKLILSLTSHISLLN